MRNLLSLLSLLALLVSACATPSSSAPRETPSATSAREATMYRSPTCGCCGEYERILREAGWTIEVVETLDTAAWKTSRGIPEATWSCHTMVIAGYLVEGHVPLAAIDRLLARRPAIDGIALPGMPAGSPGMGGIANGLFEVVAFDGGTTAPFGSY